MASAPPEACVIHLADAQLEGSRLDVKGDKEKDKIAGTYVVMWLADACGAPVGSGARWPLRQGMSPSWHSARAVGSGAGVGLADCRLRVELWQRMDSGTNALLAGPIVLPVTELEATPRAYALHGSSRDAAMGRVSSSYVITLHAVPPTSSRKHLFLIRHGESKWNAAKREKNVFKMVRQHDHPINEQGYRQAHALQVGLIHAVEEDKVRPNDPSKPRSLMQTLLRAEALWASPLTRAVQTALVALEPLLRMPGKQLELKIYAREKKNWGGFDSTGIVCGSACGQRALAELRSISTTEVATEAEVTSKLSKLRLEPLETENNHWWSEGAESDESLGERMQELLLQMQYSTAESIVLVGHSHFFRGFFQRYLHPSVHHRSPEMATELQSSSVPNCAVLHCQLDFGCSPFVVTSVTQIHLAAGDDLPSKSSASRPAAAHMDGELRTRSDTATPTRTHRTTSV